MFKRKSLGLLLVGSLLTGNVAYASFGDAVVGGVVGGVVGSVITNEVYNKQRPRRKTHRVKKYHKAKKRYVAPAPRIDTSEMKIQKSLKALGFYRGQIDGEVNSYETRSAIKSMNMAYELGNTASLSPSSRDALIYLGDLFMFDRILISKDSSRKAKAKKIQAALKIHGFYHDKIDGAIGAGTRRNISEYKRAKGLSGGSSFDFEEEYQLISSAKQMNDQNIDATIASLKGAQRQYQPANTKILSQQPAVQNQVAQPQYQQAPQQQPVQVMQNQVTTLQAQ
jgi:hypothetical protein